MEYLDKEEITRKLRDLKTSKEKKQFQFYLIKEEWKKAIETGCLLEKTENVSYDFYQIMAIAYSEIRNTKKATINMKRCLEQYIGEDVGQFIKKASNLIFSESKMISEYVYLGGKNNLGLITHKDKDEKEETYMTKIIPQESSHEHLIKKEIVFNEKIRKRSESLQSITPALISEDGFNEQHLKLLTFEKKGKGLGAKVAFNKILELNKIVTDSIPYEDGISLLKGKVTQDEWKMHKRNTHVTFIDAMREISEEIDNIGDLTGYIDRIEQVIVDNEAYKEIIPERDYFFCHGDLNKGNIIFDEREDNYYIIDWTHYGFALRGHDPANYLLKFDCDFSEVFTNYLPKISLFHSKDSLEERFFVYKLLIGWIKQLTKENALRNMDKKIGPAVAYLEEME